MAERREEYSRLDIGMCIGMRIAIGGVAVLLCWELTAQKSTRTLKPDAPAVLEWKTRIALIQKTLEGANEERCRGAPAPEIVDAFGLESGPLSVALVDYCSSGAYTDSLFPMILDHGKPVQATFRDIEGKKVHREFVSGASAMHSRSVELAASEKAIFDCFTDNDAQGRIAECGVKAYVWNAKSRTFDLDNRRSKSASAEYCQRMRAGQ
ncbi:MAG: hypothetical protein JST28_03020 [Acidobacteria bacterium]|nr:hypothetical protein [Acidobacteriota bacterium]